MDTTAPTTHQQAAAPHRNRLPDERDGITHHFAIDGHEGYVTVNRYEGGKAGEVFIRMAKQGSMVSGLMDSTALAMSVALQHGVPVQSLARKWCNTQFYPAGFTTNPRIPTCTSVFDYLGRWLLLKFPPCTDTLPV